MKSTTAKAAVAAAAPGTNCYTAYRPNGHEAWGVSNVRNASCGFAKAVGLAVMQPGHVTSNGDVTALSPTGRYIRMHCVSGDAPVITCSGGNDAVVQIGMNTGF